jgi:anti-anti-sigma factor
MGVELVQNKYLVVRVTEDVDLSNVSDFDRYLDEAMEKARGSFIVDLTECTYLDSAGIQAILRIWSRMRELGAPLVIAVGSARVRVVLDIVRLDQLPGICMVANVEDAEQILARIPSKI